VNGCDKLVPAAHRLPVALDEVLQRHQPVAAATSEFNLRIQRQQWRHAIGRWRGIAQVAGDGCPVLDLHGPNLARSLLQRVKGGRQVPRPQCRSRWSARRCGLRRQARG
jgi:hypothetical protein